MTQSRLEQYTASLITLGALRGSAVEELARIDREMEAAVNAATGRKTEADARSRELAARADGRLSEAREVLATIGMEGHLPQKIRGARSGLPPSYLAAEDALQQAVVGVKSAVAALQAHDQHSRENRLAEAEQREREAEAARRKRAADEQALRDAATRDWAARQRRATLIAALLGAVALILGAAIAVAVGPLVGAGAAVACAALVFGVRRALMPNDKLPTAE